MAYFYGAFQLDAHANGLGYFLQARDLDNATYTPVLSALARYDGFKVNGWQVQQRQIQCDITIVGTSLADCLTRKDTLEAALAPRDQQLILHPQDTRYWTANAISGKCKISSGKGVVKALMPVVFLCADPYARAQSSSLYDSGSVLYTASGGVYASPLFTFTGGGTYYGFPQIHLIHQTPALGSTTLTTGLTAGAQYNALFVVNTTFSAVAGQVLNITYSTGAPLFQYWTQRVVVTSAFATSTIQINVSPFIANFSFPSGASVALSTAWNTVQVTNLTDNYTIAAASSFAAPLPQNSGDFLDIYCDPTTGWQIATNGLQPYLDPIGAFPVVEPGSNQWQLLLAADSQPTVDASWLWVPRYSS